MPPRTSLEEALDSLVLPPVMELQNEESGYGSEGPTSSQPQCGNNVLTPDMESQLKLVESLLMKETERLPASLPEEHKPQNSLDFTPSDLGTPLTLKAVITEAPETQSVVSSPAVAESADKKSPKVQPAAEIVDKKSPKVQPCKDKSPNILRRIKHPCSVCTKAFASPKTLQKHMATHEVSSKSETPEAQNPSLNLQNVVDDLLFEPPPLQIRTGNALANTINSKPMAVPITLPQEQKDQLGNGLTPIPATFPQQKNAKKTSKKVATFSEYPCTNCHKVFPSPSKLKRHNTSKCSQQVIRVM